MTTAFADVSAAHLSDLLSLTGRHAVVTGGAQGLGKAIAFRLAESGANVLIGDINRGRAQAAADEITQRYSVRALGVAMDVTDSESVRTGASAAAEGFGGIDIWVNNAGIFPSIPVLQTPDDTWEQVDRKSVV